MEPNIYVNLFLLLVSFILIQTILKPFYFKPKNINPTIKFNYWLKYNVDLNLLNKQWICLVLRIAAIVIHYLNDRLIPMNFDHKQCNRVSHIVNVFCSSVQFTRFEASVCVFAF